MQLADFSVRVYYEDTDSGGVVYYANYLKFAERARTEALRQLGVNQSDLWVCEDAGFVVRRVHMDLRKPARLDDLLYVKSRLQSMKKARMSMEQTIYCAEMVLAEIVVELACVNTAFAPRPIPDAVRRILTLSL